MKISVKMTRAENVARFGAGPVSFDLEEYLCGVVPSEVYESSHMEALKAQAVAARTFAAKRAMSGTVVDDTTRFQAFRAALMDTCPRSRQAVEETAGQVLTYGGALVDCFYSASNGGTTKRSGEVWSRDYPYYVSKPDPWDAAACAETPTAASHGVGLSQMGCMWAAKNGVPYHEILAFYYDGAALVHEYGTGSAVAFEEETGGFAMNLHKLIFTKNACYKAGRKIIPKGIMVHSTGANNPWLKRYIGPDDGLLGKNQYNNHWNQDKPDGRQVCVHGFIGKLADGTVATYQTLPWDHRGWHCGSGSKGSGNDTHISFEICEANLSDASYFSKVYNEAVELCAYLCKLYGLTEKNIICHSEGHTRGIASNHGDVMHWFPKHGKNMDTFRAAVKAKLAGSSGSSTGNTGSLYRVRKSWKDAASQLGAYAVLDNAKAQADKNPGYAVFDESGRQVYPAASSGSTDGIMYRVRRSWADAASQKGAFKVLDNAKKCADDNAGYSVFDEAGKVVYTGKAAVSTYTVKKGDSLWAIAARKLGSGSRYPEIKKLNGLTSDVIHSGQVLKIPSK